MLDTEISPELIPGDGDKPTADSESKVGPYELQDFFLFYILRFGYRPSKVAFLAEHAWGDRDARPVAGPDPATSAATSTRAPRSSTGSRSSSTASSASASSSAPRSRTRPKVGSGGSLSPRGDWRAPSDSNATVWLDELRANVPDD